MTNSSCVVGGNKGLAQDTTGTITTIGIVSDDIDVTISSPVRSPGVLDDPSILIINLVVSDSEDTVINLLSTEG